MEDCYKSIEKPAEGFYRDRNSRFLSFGFPVSSVEEIHNVLDGIKRKYHDARHHCYAYELGFQQKIHRMNDDGEPAGTAGKLIYSQLVSHDLTDILAIVVRYFGGTLLGTNGLINAYRSATADMLSRAVIVQKYIEDRFIVSFPYASLNAVMKVIKEMNLVPLYPEYSTQCTMNIMVRKGLSARFTERLSLIHGVILELHK